jgi:GNAT superfamily N-acetyltransferase
MFARCSEETCYRRFHGPVRAIPRRYLAEALSGRPHHYALVAEAPSGAITALASCCTVAPGAAELGVLVEDSWQGLGLGGFLLKDLIHYSERSGHTVVTATILRHQAWIIRLLRAYGPCDTAPADEALVVTLRLRPHPANMSADR